MKDTRGVILLGGRQCADDGVEMGTYDALRAAQTLQGRQAQDRFAGLHFFGPQTAHHQLQIGRLHTRRTAGAAHGAAARFSHKHLVGLHLRQHLIHQGRFDGDGLDWRHEAVVGQQRLLDGVAGGRHIQVLDAQVVLEQAGNAALEAIKPGQGILTNGNEEVDAQIGVIDRARKLHRQGAQTIFRGMVEEVFLELIEDEQEVAVERGGPGLQGGHERGGRGRSQGGHGRMQRSQVGLQGGVDAVQQAGQGVIAPGVDDDDGELRVAVVGQVLGGQVTQVMDDSGAQHGAFAHAAGAIEQRQACGNQVGLDHVALTLAAKEEVGVILAVGNQAFVGREWQGMIVHERLPVPRPPSLKRFCRRSLKPATNCSRLRSRMSTL